MLRMWRDWFVRVFSISHYPDHHWYCRSSEKSRITSKIFTTRIRYIRVIFGILYVQPLLDGIIIGLMVGLSATGLYSGSKNVFKTSGKQSGKK